MTEIVAIVPARGGSKGILRKNLVDLGGRPLIVWTVGAAVDCAAVTRVVVSTEDEEIAAVAVAAGAEWPFARPVALAGDNTPMLDVVRHTTEALQLEDDTIIALLQPTSPFRTANDISAAVQAFRETGAQSLISVVSSEAHPYWALRIDATGRTTPFFPDIEKAVRRQDLEPAYRPNGAIYLVRAATIRAGGSWYGPDAVAFEMPRERSIDIDDAWDLDIARAICAQSGNAALT